MMNKGRTNHSTGFKAHAALEAVNTEHITAATVCRPPVVAVAYRSARVSVM